MPHPYFSHAALGISLLPAAFGLNAYLRPTAALRAADLPVPPASDVQGNRLISGLMRKYGARNIAEAYLLVLIWRTGNPRWMAMGLLAGAWMALVDGWVRKELTGSGQWKHWGFVLLVGVIVAGLLG